MAGVDSDSIRVVSAEIQRDGEYLIAQRYAKAVLPLLWEFPGGRVREGQSDRERLSEAVEMRVGVEPVIGELLLEIVHDYDDYQVTLVVYRCELEDEPFANNVNAIAWVKPEDFADYPFPGADAATVEMLLADDP